MSIEVDEQAGFGEVFDEAPVLDTAAEDTQNEPEVIEDGSEGTEAPNAEPVEPEPEPLTTAQLRELAERVKTHDAYQDEIRRVQGKYGELHRTLQQMQQPRGVQLSSSKLTRLSEQYPELAELLANDLNEALQVQGGGQSFDPNQVEQIVSSRVNQATDGLSKQVQTLSLSLAHNDWEQVTSSPEFSTWASALPADEQQMLADSWDAKYLAKKITEFKVATKTQREASSKASAKAKVIQAAVTPTGSKASLPATDSEADAFFKAANAR